MEGAKEAAFEKYEVAMYQAYQTARLSVLAENGKLGQLSKHMPKRAHSEKSKAAQALAWAHSLKARGIPVKIERVQRKVDG
jgi:hypothetical protein